MILIRENNTCNEIFVFTNERAASLALRHLPCLLDLEYGCHLKEYADTKFRRLKFPSHAHPLINQTLANIPRANMLSNTKNLANLLRHYRLTNNLKQSDVAKHLGLKSTAIICRWEKSNRQPSLPNIKKLAKFYQTTIDNLFPDTAS